MIVRKIVAGALAGVSAALGLAACGTRGGLPAAQSSAAPAPTTTRPTHPWSPPMTTPTPETTDEGICYSFHSFDRDYALKAQEKLADDFKANPNWSWDDPQIRVDALAFIQHLKDFSWKIHHFVSEKADSEAAGRVGLVAAHADDTIADYEKSRDDKKKFALDVAVYWDEDNLAHLACLQSSSN